MVAKINKPGVPKKKPAASYKLTPPHNPDPKFGYEGLVHRGPKPSPTHPDIKFRGDPEKQKGYTPQANKATMKKGKTYRSSTGGTVKLLKGIIDPSKRKQP